METIIIACLPQRQHSYNAGVLTQCAWLITIRDPPGARGSRSRLICGGKLKSLLRPSHYLGHRRGHKDLELVPCYQLLQQPQYQVEDPTGLCRDPLIADCTVRASYHLLCFKPSIKGLPHRLRVLQQPRQHSPGSPISSHQCVQVVPWQS